METAIIIAQVVVIIGLFFELLYVAYNKPSKVQTLMVLLLATTIVMLTGYTMELIATSEEAAMFGVAISYIGKPFALVTALLFIAEYCRINIPKKISVPLIAYSTIFPILIFSNRYHHLYYSTIEFDLTRAFSPLKLGHGPLYYFYMAEIFLVFIAINIMFVRELAISKSKDSRKRLWLLFGIIASSVVGYVLYLLGLTGGYDTTMVGTVVGVAFLSSLFIKYRLFDYLNLAKEMSLSNATTGIVVVDTDNNIIYQNNMITTLFNEITTLDELLEHPNGESLLEKDSKIYEVKSDLVVEKGHVFGRAIQINDVTTKLNYSRQLEAEVAQRANEILHIQRSVISSFAGIVEARDNNTGAHITRMSKYVEATARALQKCASFPAVIDEKFVKSLVDVAPLHDIGKICIPDAILLKPGELDYKERKIMRTHTTEGARIIEECLSGVESDEYVVLAKDVALYHHERYDGTGYPKGLSGSNIPLAARIVAIADVYDALRSERCYKASMTKAEALGIIKDGKGKQFDPYVVDAFVEAVEKDKE